MSLRWPEQQGAWERVLSRAVLCCKCFSPSPNFQGLPSNLSLVVENYQASIFLALEANNTVHWLYLGKKTVLIHLHIFDTCILSLPSGVFYLLLLHEWFDHQLLPFASYTLQYKRFSVLRGGDHQMRPCGGDPFLCCLHPCWLHPCF